MDRRVLLIVNRGSGTGSPSSLAGRLAEEIAAAAPSELEVALVEDHPSARRATRRFLAASSLRAAVISAGGGGTLRAAVEGVCDVSSGRLPGECQLVLGALRLGSGNVVARRLGMVADPLEGMRQLMASMAEDRTKQCAVIRCRFGTADGGEDVRHCVTMCGLGQFGRTSGDLARWHASLAGPRRALAAAIGLERLNSIEYAASATGRFGISALVPQTAEAVEVTLGERRERFRLLAGAVMNLPISAIPFHPRVSMDEAAAGVLLLPRGGRLRSWRLDAGEELRVELLDRESVEFFLDEDPERAHHSLTIDIRGGLAFLPGARGEAA